MGAQEDRLTEDEMSGWLAAGAALHKGTLCLWDLLAAHTPEDLFTAATLGAPTILLETVLFCNILRGGVVCFRCRLHCFFGGFACVRFRRVWSACVRVCACAESECERECVRVMVSAERASESEPALLLARP